MMISKKCEWYKHKGDPTKNHGEGIWWLKDPEWILLCPNCKNQYWIDFMNKYIEEKQLKGGG